MTGKKPERKGMYVDLPSDLFWWAKKEAADRRIPLWRLVADALELLRRRSGKDGSHK